MKYILNDIVNIEQYHEKNSKLPWIILYSGNIQDEEKVFKTKEEALNFINKDLGDIYDDELAPDDRKFSNGKRYLYEEPSQFIFDTVKDDRVLLNEGDYIFRVKKKNNMIRDIVTVLSNQEFNVLFRTIDIIK